MRQAKPNGTDSSMDFRKFRSRNMVPTVGMMKKPGDNHLGAHGARGQKISFSNRKAGGKGQSAAPARSGKFCHCPNDPSPPDGTDPHPLLQSCSLSVYSFHVCSCGAPGQPLPLGPPESGSLHSDRCLPLIHHGLFPLYLGYAKEKKMCSLIARYIHLFKQKTRVTILDE